MTKLSEKPTSPDYSLACLDSDGGLLLVRTGEICMSLIY